jgi:oligopeptide/dipeptide ABC transporter ATP-binding protein
VNGVSFEIPEGQTVGLVGESGSGKTTVGRAVARLLEPTEGTIRFDGQDVTHIRGTALSDYLPNVQVVFQDPFNSLNPRLTVGKIVEEPLAINRRGTRTERQKRVGELLEAVGISPTDADRMPADFSGGQRQRIAICRALALSPKLVVCDEAVSALDVSIQAKILNLLVDLQDRFALTYLFISHDLSVVRLVSDYIVVMYLGQVVETAAAEDVFSKPLHPYTKALMDAVPDLHKRQEMTAIPGEIPSNITPPIGCPFYSRCPKRMEICQENPPQLVEVEDGRYVACFLYHNEVDASRIGNGAGRRAKAGPAILQRRS